ncbi:hypothetical protein [Bacillus sp. Marseille-Q3570]|nr:hypothetical protein [Bacillus sp. Marseille-Q3570]
MEKRKKEEPTVAPGMDDYEQLKKDATEEDIKKGDSTTVTRLSLDEVDPS